MSWRPRRVQSHELSINKSNTHTKKNKSIRVEMKSNRSYLSDDKNVQKKSPSSFDSLSLKDPERTIPMLRGRSASDTVLPRGDAPYSSIEASCVGMLLDRVILGGPPAGLGTVIRNRVTNALQYTSNKCMRVSIYHLPS